MKSSAFPRVCLAETQSQRCLPGSSARRYARIGCLLLVLSASLIGRTLRGADPPIPSADDVRALMREQPLTLKTWPVWRDYYLRLHYTYDVGEPIEFYEQIGAFMGEAAARNQGELPTELADDPLAWVNFSRHLMHLDPPQLEAAMAASRRALELGDPSGIPSFSLARSLIHGVSTRGTADLSNADERHLDEAAERLRVVRQLAPAARLQFWEGLIAWYRGDQQTALPLLKQGALESSRDASRAVTYLTLYLASDDATPPVSDETAPFAEQFTDEARILAVHAAALFRDQRYAEAYDTLQEARRLDEREVLEFLGPQAVAAYEEGRWLTPAVQEGLQLLEQKLYGTAISRFRDVLSHHPENLFAARLFARSLVGQFERSRGPENAPAVDIAEQEIRELCRRFPGDPELLVAHAFTLFRAGKGRAAADALQQAEQAGGNLSELLGRAGRSAIEDAARRERITRAWLLGIAGVASVWGAWILLMFLLGALLAAFTKRIPDLHVERHGARGARDAWLERFYLVVLGSSVCVFYLSVPAVAAGLLAITLALFGLMLIIRIIHFGILYRGMYAIWGVLRSAFVGFPTETVGIVATEGQHPRLFAAMREVAERLETKPVDRVYLTPDSAIGVREEGRGPFGVFSRKRIMEIGISTLPQLTLAEFKSILAHEFGHFSHRDPAYTRVISQITASLAHSLAVMNAAGGVLNYLNPFYWFYWLYLRGYALLAAGFSRSREFLADRRAALAYGKETFISALTKVCVDGMLFEGTAVPNIGNELAAGRSFVNVYDAYRNYREQPELCDVQQDLLESVRNRKPSWYDSHPTYSERLAAVESLPSSREPPSDGPATDVLTDKEKLEEQLSDLLTRQVYQAQQLAQQAGE